MVFLSILLISLQSLYSQALGLPLYSTIGAVLLMACAVMKLGKSQKNLSYRNIFRPLILGPLGIAFVSIIAFLYNKELLFSRVPAILLISSIPISYSLISNHVDPISIIKKLIIFHMSVFYTQFILYYGFKVDLDPVALLSDAAQSGWGGTLNHEFLGKFRRLGGMYNEPGTYATFVAPLVAMFSASQINRSSAGKSDTYILLLSLLSLALTFSIFAWVFCAIITATTFATSIKKSLLLVPFIPLVIWLALPYISYRFYNSSSNIDSGLGFREEIWNNIQIYSTESLPNLLWGYSFLNDKVPFRYSGAINDVGLLPYSVLYGGVFGAAIIVFLTVKSGWNLGLSGIAVYGILLSSKVSIFAPMFWLMLALSLHVSFLYGAKRKYT